MYTERIKYIYNLNPTTSSQSTPLTAGIIILIFIFIIGYLYYEAVLKEIMFDWENKRCSPKYIFYSGFFKSPTGNQFNDTYTNFKDCTDPMKRQHGRFDVVFDTANVITDTANYIIGNTQTIMSETDRVKNENINKVSSVKDDTNILITSMNQLYNHQLKLYTILQMYFERIFLLLDNFATYTTDIILWELSNMRYGLSYQGTQLTPFINMINSDYNRIYSNEIESVTTIFSKLNTTGTIEEYNKAISDINSATNKYKELTKTITLFDDENTVKLLQIDNLCETLKVKKVSYRTIFPFL